MFCRNCQTIIPDDSLFCENCGAPTGLDPESIDDSNLVPEEAVEYEVTRDEEPVVTSSVPVDPVWWEPPEDEGPIDVDAAPVPEEDTAGEEPDDWDVADLKWQHPDEIREAQAEEAPEEKKPAVEEPADIWASDDWTADDWTADDWGSDEKSEEEAAAAKAGAPEPEPEEEAEAFGEKAAEPEEDAAGGFEEEESPASEDIPEEQSAKEETHINAEELKRMAVVAAEAAKPYAGKAREWLGNLGRNVRTGTGWAADAAKEQFHQRREEYQEKKEQRDQQREQEKKERELERKRREREREREQQRRRELEGAIEENVIQQPGFWYGDKMPEPKVVIAPAVKVSSGEAAQRLEKEHPDAEPAATSEKSKETDRNPETDEVIETAAVTEGPSAETTSPAEDAISGDETDSAEEATPSDETDLDEGSVFTDEADSTDGSPPSNEADSAEEATPSDETDLDEGSAFADEADSTDGAASADEADSDKEATSDDEADSAEEATPPDEPAQTRDESSSSLDEENIRDKLANTARYDWSRGDLEAVAAGFVDPGLIPAKQAEAEGVENVDQPLHNEEDDPEMYRIRDFGPGKAKKMKGRFMINRNRWIMIFIIVAIIAAIIGVAALMVHQAHVRQMEEEAYQADLKKAHQLVEKKKYKKAEKRYLALIDQRPEDTAPYLGLAQMYIDRQRYVDAKALIKRAEKATGDKEAFKKMKKEIKILTSTGWKKEYIEVLEEYESDIRRYEEDVTASTAVCDINGDRRPELFFFTKEYYGYGKLHIYTIVDKKAKEVDYECKNRGTQYHDAFYDVSSSDSSYAIFNTNEDGRFAIYANVASGGESWDTTNEFSLNLKGGCKQVNVIEGAIDPTYSEEERDDSKYELNEEDISYDKYIAEFRRILDGVQQVVLYNGSGGDQAVWDKITQDNVMCMPYNAIMTDLRAK